MVVKEMMLEEAWSAIKPLVHYFKLFGCVAHVHILEARRKKLDDKSFRCVMLGMSDESKAYRLYYPATKRIVISNVIFEEDKCWDWGRNSKEMKPDVLDWGESGESEDEDDSNDNIRGG